MFAGKTRPLCRHAPANNPTKWKWRANIADQSQYETNGSKGRQLFLCGRVACYFRGWAPTRRKQKKQGRTFATRRVPLVPLAAVSVRRLPCPEPGDSPHQERLWSEQFISPRLACSPARFDLCHRASRNEEPARASCVKRTLWEELNRRADLILCPVAYCLILNIAFTTTQRCTYFQYLRTLRTLDGCMCTFCTSAAHLALACTQLMLRFGSPQTKSEQKGGEQSLIASLAFWRGGMDESE